MAEFFLANSIYFKDALDILIVAILIYAVILLLERTRSLFLFNGIGVVTALYLLTGLFGLKLTGAVLNFFVGFFVVVFVVVFQKELRHFFEWISILKHISRSKRETISEVVTNQIIQACLKMAEQKTGALIVLQGEQPLDLFLDGGITLNGKVSVPLLLSIFDTSSPGHDGAIIMEGDKIKLFGVHLPLAENLEALKGRGTRHRSALGIAESTDAMVIVVSEERGEISLAQGGYLETIHDEDEFSAKVFAFLRQQFLATKIAESALSPKKNLKEKGIALLLALLLWFIFVQ